MHSGKTFGAKFDGLIDVEEFRRAVSSMLGQDMLDAEVGVERASVTIAWEPV